MNELALFAGAGGGILGGLLSGWRTVCAVERDAWCASVLARRQDDGILAPFPIWSDVCSFDGNAWRGLVDVVSGGFPCQDISVAGKGAGIEGERSGLWREFFRIICEVRPRFAYVENSPALASRGLTRVLADFASIGADAQWVPLSAAACGAWHERTRLWLVADLDGAWEQQPKGIDREIGGRLGDGATVAADIDGSKWRPKREARDGLAIIKNSLSQRQESSDRPAGGTSIIANADRSGQQEQLLPIADGSQHSAPECGDWWAAEPGVVRMVHGMANRVDRIGALGNGQVPIVAARAWDRLSR